MGFLCVGLHLFLDFCHVYVLPSGTLSKVCPPTAPFLMLSTHNPKEADNALELRHSAELCPFFLPLLSPPSALLHANKPHHLGQRQFILPPEQSVFSLNVTDCSDLIRFSPPSQAQCVCFFLKGWRGINFFPLRPKFNTIILGLHRSAYDWMYTTPAVLPYGFHVSTIINVCLNTAWLFLFDRE